MRDENLADIETDKVVLELPATHSGTMQKVLKQDGTQVTSGEVIAIIEQSDVEKPEVVIDTSAPQSMQNNVIDSTSVAHLGPAAKHLMTKHNLDPSHIHASGKGGRLTKADVLAHLKQRPETPAAARFSSRSWRPGCSTARRE